MNRFFNTKNITKANTNPSIIYAAQAIGSTIAVSPARAAASIASSPLEIILTKEIIPTRLITAATIFNNLCIINFYFLCLTNKSINVIDASSISFTILSIFAMI